MYQPHLTPMERQRPLYTAVFITAVLMLTYALLHLQLGTPSKVAEYELFLACMATRHRTGDDAWAMQRNLDICTDIMVHHYTRRIEATP